MPEARPVIEVEAQAKAIAHFAACYQEGYEAGLAAGKKDAEEYGSALDEAAWAFVESYGKRLGGGMSGHFFNTVKPILRDAILAYFAALPTEPPK